MNITISQSLIIWIPIIISFIAILISFIALWKTTFSKFNPVFTAGQLGFRIYPIRNGKDKWFLPSIDLPISIANDGARPGRVVDMRIVVKFPNLPIKGNYENFLPHWEVDSMKFNQAEKRDRFQWLKEVVLGDWMSFIVLPKQTITKHIIFESRWDKPVIQNDVLFIAEIITDSSKDWKNIGEWKFSLSNIYWSELTENCTSIRALRINNKKSNELNIFPKDLHKYTGTDEKIVSGGFKTSPSYLDYPKN